MELLGINPGRRAAVYFLVTILIGTILLLLPVSTQHQSVGFVNALFTSTSAVCVTGLTVVDTGQVYSLFGQIVILILIQLGGVGVMTFATSILLSVGSKLSLNDRFGISQTFDTGTRTHPVSLLKAVVVTTLTVELAGAVALFFKFRGDFPIDTAAWLAVFHSVAAFCNAGFSLFSNNLENYNNDPAVLLIISFLIISGGLGFVVIREVYARARGREAKLSLHSKLCLVTTFVLLALGTAAIYLAEYENAFKNTNVAISTVNAFFQSVTSRTAGFNSIPQANFTDVTLLLTIILMFIGTCPGATGGGIKTTTFAVILLLVYHRFSGRLSVTAFRRSISNDSIIRSLTVVLLAALVIVFTLALFMFAEQNPVAHTLSHGWFVDNLFEVVSAFGTVGLSLGITPHLHDSGKMLLILLMFAGRVGMLTLAFALARPPQKGEIVYVEEEVLVG